jgi:NAD(P)-dependent dehydrogenase (short-subunit alcohol dehydrogenase family)
MTGSEPRPLRGKTVVITGASAGVGAAAAVKLSASGATVAVVGHSPEKTAAIAQRTGGQAHLADFGRLDDVRRLAAELLDAYGRIDVLANNAGAIFTSRAATVDGHERTFQVNHLAPFLLTNLLLPRLAEADDARVINTASDAYRSGRLDPDDLDGSRGQVPIRKAYPASKLATILFTRELARRVHGTRVTTFAFHPGLISTDLGRDSAIIGRAMTSRLARIVLKTPDQGAEPLLHLATLADPRSVNGGYFNRLELEEPVRGQAGDTEAARLLWERSAHLTGLAGEARAD